MDTLYILLRCGHWLECPAGPDELTTWTPGVDVGCTRCGEETGDSFVNTTAQHVIRSINGPILVMR